MLCMLVRIIVCCWLGSAVSKCCEVDISTSGWPTDRMLLVMLVCGMLTFLVCWCVVDVEQDGEEGADIAVNIRLTFS